MKSYSIACMRRECQTQYRLLMWEAVLCLAFAAVSGAAWKAMDQTGSKIPLIFCGIFFLFPLALLGYYLVITDKKWLFRHTCFGRELEKLGDRERLMAEIDRDAERMLYECGRFALLPGWMVLYLPGTGKNRIRSTPLPRRSIARIVWEKDTAEENAGFFVRLWNDQGDGFELYVWEQADIEALRQWSAVQETQAI